MSPQISAHTKKNAATNSSNEIHVSEYKLSDAAVFTVHCHYRCWKRLRPINGEGFALWVKQDPSGSRSLVSKRRLRWLKRIWKRRNSFPRVHRYPRNDREGERLLSDLANAHASGQPDVAITLVDRLRIHLSKSVVTDEDPGANPTWNALPRFDPNLVKKTKWLISSFLAEGSIQLVFGERGSFKSTFFLAAAQAVANGLEFLRLKTRQRRVLYLDFENPANIIKARNDDLGVGLPGNENLVVWDRFGTHPTPRPGDPLLEAIVRECAAETGHPPWIIFDSWASLLKPGEGGEFTGQIAPIYLQLRKLADLGATITILDHSRKYEKNTIYGGQDKEAKADSIHKLLTFPNSARPDNRIIRVESWLKRHAPEGVGSFAFEVQSRQDRKGDWQIAGLVPAQDPIEAKKLEYVEILRKLIKQNPNSGQDALSRLAAKQGIPRDQAIVTLKNGAGKYWRVRKTSHNKCSYSLIEK